MATSTRQFNIDLYLEHLEEASFLYQQRLAYLVDPEVHWPDLAQWEDRLEAHIDALVVGQELALDVCRRRAIEGDAGEKHAALCVFCRQRRKDDAFALLATLDQGDEDTARAVSLALRSEAPSSWRDDLLQLLESDATPSTHVLAEVIGFRRFPSEARLLTKLVTKPPRGTPEIVWALGRVGTQASVPTLRTLLDSDDERIQDAAATALLRLGDEGVVHRAMQEAPDRPWARRALGIGGGPAAVRLLLGNLKRDEADESTVLALGLLGDLTSVMPLVDLLTHEALGATAAVALNTITGAGLHGSTFVPDQFDIDELSEEERETFERDGILPTRPDGEPYGSWQQGPLRDQTGWRKWLEENKQHFTREYRWRMGRPYGPSALIETLRCATSPYVVRMASYEELLARYGVDVPFEPQLRVNQQWRFVRDMLRWEANQSGAFTPGLWYFAGQPQS